MGHVVCFAMCAWGKRLTQQEFLLGGSYKGSGQGLPTVDDIYILLQYLKGPKLWEL